MKERAMFFFDGDRFDTAAVDLGKVGGVVDDKGHNGGNKAPISGDGNPENQIGTIKDHDQLQHQGRAAHDRDVELDDTAQGSKLAASTEGDQQTQRKGT